MLSIDMQKRQVHLDILCGQNLLVPKRSFSGFCNLDCTWMYNSTHIKTVARKILLQDTRACQTDSVKWRNALTYSHAQQESFASDLGHPGIQLFWFDVDNFHFFLDLCSPPKMQALPRDGLANDDIGCVGVVCCGVSVAQNTVYHPDDTSVASSHFMPQDMDPNPFTNCNSGSWSVTNS